MAWGSKNKSRSLIWTFGDTTHKELSLKMNVDVRTRVEGGLAVPALVVALVTATRRLILHTHTHARQQLVLEELQSLYDILPYKSYFKHYPIFL